MTRCRYCRVSETVCEDSDFNEEGRRVGEGLRGRVEGEKLYFRWELTLYRTFKPVKELVCTSQELLSSR